MRSRVIVECQKQLWYFYEKIMEWFYSISSRAFPIKTARKSLVEEYVIYEHYAGEPSVRDFLKERAQKSITNKCNIKITIAPDNENHEQTEEDTETIGAVRLLRKNSLVDEATLIIKKRERNLIYWKFNK